jgi:hypothetical protein
MKQKQSKLTRELTNNELNRLFERFSRPMVRPCINSVGSMYFFKMKSELTKAQISNLKKHYGDERNFNRLERWEPPVSIKSC